MKNRRHVATTADGMIIGNTIRLLRGKHVTDKSRDQILVPPDRRSLFSDLENSFLSIKSERNLKEIISSIPSLPCIGGNSFLEEQTEYLVALLLFKMPMEYCPIFNRHLNFCPHCAAFFADVLQGFAPARGKEQQ